MKVYLGMVVKISPEGVPIGDYLIESGVWSTLEKAQSYRDSCNQDDLRFDPWQRRSHMWVAPGAKGTTWGGDALVILEEEVK